MKNFFSFFLILFLTGCSYRPSFIHDRNAEYRFAKSIPPLRIPPGIDSSKIHNNYPISDRQYPGSTHEISLVPPGLY